LSGAPVNKWLSTITRERRILPDLKSDGIPYLFGTFLSPHIGKSLTGSSRQQQQKLPQELLKPYFCRPDIFLSTNQQKAQKIPITVQ